MEATPRLTYVDFEKARLNLQFREEHAPRLLNMLKEQPGKLRQRRLALLADDQVRVGLLRYALGRPISEVRPPLRDTVVTVLEMFRLRGSLHAFPAYNLTVDPSIPAGVPGHQRLEPLRGAGEVDYSMTNSRDALWYTLLAYAVDKVDEGRELASLIWDPPDAGYIGVDSEVCTPSEQATAYALRHLLASEYDQAASVAATVRGGAYDLTVVTAMALRALIAQDRKAFVNAIGQMLHAHLMVSRRDPANPSHYICVPALGLFAMGQAMRMVGTIDIPISNVFLPTEILHT